MEEAMRTFALAVALLAVAGLARADDDDPEPPGSASLRKLMGKWVSVRRIAKGEEMAYTQLSYAFEKDKVTSSSGNGKLVRTMTLKVDKKRSDVIEMTGENVKVKTTRFFFKIEKGELFLTPTRSTDPKAKPDFTGGTGTVMILKKEK
jgi:hypothetical protein